MYIQLFHAFKQKNRSFENKGNEQLGVIDWI